MLGFFLWNQISILSALRVIPCQLNQKTEFKARVAPSVESSCNGLSIHQAEQG